MSHDVTITPTTNEWDARVAFYRLRNGNVLLRRDDTAPDEEWGNRTFWPHAVVIVDGQMSEFDAARQPPPARQIGAGLVSTAEEAITRLERSLRNVSSFILHIPRDEAKALVAGWRTPSLLDQPGADLEARP